jgi:glyoxylase-like metal-dependent hydrolase (beta-lactamase superfamily II)
MHIRATVAMLLLIAAAASTTEASPHAVTPGAFRVHTLNIPEAAFANMFLIETAQHAAAVDAGFDPKRDGSRLRALADSLGKPIAYVLLTHGHVDHYGGLPGVRSKSAPVLASAGVARQIEDYDSTNFARFGIPAPDGDRSPTRVMRDGETLDLDGVRFELRVAGPGESYEDALWRVSGKGREAWFVGDVAMYGLFPFMQSGHSANWLRTLDMLERRADADLDVYVGHDVTAAERDGRPWDASVFRWQAARVRDFRAAVMGLTGGRRLLEAGEAPRVLATLQARAPENLPMFGFLVTTTANVVAAELMLEEERLGFEHALRAVFGVENP